MSDQINTSRNRTSLAWPRRALVLTVLLAGLWNRLAGIEANPQPFAVQEECYFLWSGLSLLTEGRPTSWSNRVAYRLSHEKDGRVVWMPSVQWRDRNFIMVRPALDYPPLFSLVAGLFARMTGAHRVAAPQWDGTTFPMWDVDLGRARLLALILYCATFLLLFEVGRRVFSFEVALLAALLYAFIAPVVACNRLIVAENMTTPLFLLDLWAVQRYATRRWSQRAFALVVVPSIAAALLCNPVDVAQAAAVIYALLLLGRRRETIYPILGVLLGGALWLAYGWWQGWPTFCAVLGAQFGPLRNFNVLTGLLTVPALLGLPSFSYLLFLGWLALFAALFYRPRERAVPDALLPSPCPPRTGSARGGSDKAAAASSGTALLGAPLIYLLVASFFTSFPASDYWRALPFYPFLCLALADVIVRVHRRCDVLPFACLIVLMLPGAVDVVFYSHAGQGRFIRLAYLVGVPLLLLLPFAGGHTNQRTVRFTTICVLALALLGEFWTTRLGI